MDYRLFKRRLDYIRIMLGLTISVYRQYYAVSVHRLYTSA